jgi:tetratricopeptide (TPR) repeat protein
MKFVGKKLQSTQVNSKARAVWWGVGGESRNSPILAILILVVLTGTLRFTSHLSYGWSNAGSLLLNHGQAQAPAGQQPFLWRAERYLQTAVHFSSHHSNLQQRLALTLARLGEEEQALEQWQKAGASAEDFMRWGQNAQEMGRHREALLWYQRAIQIDSQSSPAWYLLAQTYAALKNGPEALSAYAAAIERAHQDQQVQLSTLYYHQGMANQWLQEPANLTEAAHSYTIALQIDNFANSWQKADSFNRLGQILQWRGEDVPRQIELFQASIAIDPAYSTPRVLLGYAHYLWHKDVAAAEEEINMALTITPNYLTAYRYLGEIYFQEQNYLKALTIYAHLLTLDPNQPDIIERMEKIEELQRQ